MDSSRRIILWISDQMLRELAAGEPFLAECFWGAGPKLYHFPIYYEEILRGFLLKLAMSEILEGMMSRTAESVRSWTEAI